MAYRIIWFISPPYVARAAEMASSKGGLIANKGGIYIVYPIILTWLVSTIHQSDASVQLQFSRSPTFRVLYPHLLATYPHLAEEGGGGIIIRKCQVGDPLLWGDL